MENIIIKLLEEADIQELLKFEIENRIFLREWVLIEVIVTTKLIILMQ